MGVGGVNERKTISPSRAAESRGKIQEVPPSGNPYFSLHFCKGESEGLTNEKPFPHPDAQRDQRENSGHSSKQEPLFFAPLLQTGVGGVNEMKTISPCRTAKKAEGKFRKSLQARTPVFGSPFAKGSRRG
jgi:hypothetical protein